jgi:hypothetical protein
VLRIWIFAEKERKRKHPTMVKDHVKHEILFCRGCGRRDRAKDLYNQGGLCRSCLKKILEKTIEVESRRLETN